MADTATLERALRNADAAGDTVAAKRLAQELTKVRGAGSATPAAPALAEDQPVDPRKAKVQADFDALGFLPKLGVAADDTIRLAGSLFGATDKLAAKANSWWEGTPYEQELERQKQLTEDARTRAGLAGTVAEVGGDVASFAATGATGLIPKAATGLPKLAGVLGLSAAEGGAAGALSAWGDDEDIGEGALMGGALGVGGGAAGSALGKIGSKAIGYFKDVPIPGKDQLKAVTDHLYKEVERLGAEYSPTQIKRLAKEVVSALDKSRLNPKIHPTTLAKAVELVDDAKHGVRTKQGMSVQELDEFRQYAQQDLGANKQERRLRRPMIKTIDNFIEKTNPSTGPFAADVHKGILAAREAAATGGKADDISEALMEANLTANPTTAVRTGTRKFLKKKQRDRFSPEELAAVRKVAVPGNAESFFENLGKLGGGNMLGIGTTAASAGAAGAIMQDPRYMALGAAIPVLGAVGRRRSRKIQNRNIDEMMRTITKTPQKFKLSGQTDAEIARLITMLGLEASE